MIDMDNTTTLDRVPPGVKAEIIDVTWPGRGFLYRLYQMGLTPGTIVEVIANYGAGPVIIRVRGVETAVGRGIASRIIVRILK